MAGAGSRQQVFRDLLRRREGATAIEYALIAGFIVLAIVVAVAELGRQVDGLYSLVGDRVTAATGD